MSPTFVPVSRFTIPVLAGEDYAFNVKLALAAISVTCVSYGMQLILCIHCIRRLWARQPRTHFTIFLLFYTAFLGVVNTIWMATAPSSLQLYIMEWLQECRPISGQVPETCPKDLQAKYEWDTWLVDTLSVVSYVTGSAACDALLIWRCRQIWRSTSSRYTLLVTVLPILLLVGSIVVSNFFYPEDFRPENYIYLSITLALNILLTSLIIGRLSYCKHKIRQLMEEAEVNHYTFVSTMFIESAAPNVLCSIAMIISVAANTSYFQIAYAVSPAVQACANYFIILRGLQGIQGSWSDTSVMSSVRFAHTVEPPASSQVSPNRSQTDLPGYTKSEGKDNWLKVPEVINISRVNTA
ncbi:hypothetical protein QCA50_014723 [Cerrena zonata]|uniref:Uncharacterized protein n=1 Tax=Cerrena zonata TaxID=2478898 RepID=A0AAW0FXV6_9APHY